MLMSQALVFFLEKWQNGFLEEISVDLMRQKLPIMLVQGALHILLSRAPDGSIGKKASREETSYAVIALAHILAVPFIGTSPLREPILDTISRARAFLERPDDSGLKAPTLKSHDYLWVGKITFAADSLNRAYILGALNVPVPAIPVLGPAIDRLAEIPFHRLQELSKFYAKTPLFSTVPEWQLQGSVMEAFLFLPQLRQIKCDVFDRRGLPEEAYLELIPFSWVAIDHMDQTFASPETLFDMMHLSLLIYHLDEYVESVIEGTYSNHLEGVTKVVRRIFSEPELPNGLHHPEQAQGPLSEVYDKLSRFVSLILQHPHLMHSSKHDSLALRMELETYLLAQLQQCKDNKRLRSQLSPRLFEAPPTSYVKWCRGVAAEHVCGPCSFAFFTCLVSKNLKNGQDVFPSAPMKYVAESCCSHLAALCRIENDIGSLSRDLNERNLNSVNFPEFVPSQATDAELKYSLSKVADFERRRFETAMEHLQELCRSGRERVFQLFLLYSNTVRFYGQLHMLKDLSRAL